MNVSATKTTTKSPSNSDKSTEQKTKVIQYYELICRIGQGTFGDVYKAKHITTGRVRMYVYFDVYACACVCVWVI